MVTGVFMPKIVPIGHLVHIRITRLIIMIQHVMEQQIEQGLFTGCQSFGIHAVKHTTSVACSHGRVSSVIAIPPWLLSVIAPKLHSVIARRDDEAIP